jgi:hypothetical protein
MRPYPIIPKNQDAPGRSALNVSSLKAGIRFAAGVLLLAGMGSFQNKTQGIPSGKTGLTQNLILRFKATVHGQPLQLHKKYINPFGESFELDMFRLYIGKITASCSGRPTKKIYTGYHLVDFADSASTLISLHLPEGNYDKIDFQLGIDSIDQVSGAQTGELDPLKGMFWTWNSGYMSFKIGGLSPESTEPAHTISYHIGGYRFPNSTTGKVKINMPGNKVFRVNKEATISLDIPMELDHFFNGPTPVHISRLPACTTPGEPAHRLFENFTGIFTGIQIKGKP